MTAARPKRRRAADGHNANDQTLITSTAKRQKGVSSLLLPLRTAEKQHGGRVGRPATPVATTDEATGQQPGRASRRQTASREATPLALCPAPSCSATEAEQEGELFSPPFHALPEDHSHLEVHDAPAAHATPTRNRSLTPQRAVRVSDENTEPPLPPCASAVSASTSAASAGPRAGAAAHAGPPGPLAEAPADEEEDEEGPVFDPFAFIKSLPPLSDCVGDNRRALLPRQTRSCKQKTLVLDLDETLVHSSLDVCVRSDFDFPVTINNTIHMVHVRTRPHLQQFLETVSALFEVVIFTASQRVYAEQLLNIIDANKQYIRHRLYRDSCVYVDGNYLKDLTVLGRNLEHTVIVDNSPQAFGFQLANGIPIESWYDNDDDCELLHLSEFLKHLAKEDDVRPVITQTFKLHEVVEQA